jgi:hypothetical protein
MSAKLGNSLIGKLGLVKKQGNVFLEEYKNNSPRNGVIRTTALADNGDRVATN